MSKTLQLNIPISKIDEEQRIVTGIATSEALDSQGDIVDYEASKKAFSEWKGNIREMHNPVAVGKSIDVQFDDANKQVILSAYISKSPDGENAWTKVKEGILTGFSIGGKIFEVAKDKAVEGANRVVDYALSETSLVDNPANPEAKLVMVKSANGNLERVETMSKAGVAVVDGDARDEKANSVTHVVAGTAPVKGGSTVPKKVYGADGKSTTNKKADAPMKKSVYHAQEALAAASTIAYLIMVEGQENEPDQMSDLTSAFNAITAFVAKEVVEGDDYELEYNEVMELANNVINLRKGNTMAKEEVIEKSTAVHAGEERDENAEVVTSAEDNGRPVNDTEERAAEAGVEVDKGEEVTVPTEGDTVEAEAEAVTEDETVEAETVEVTEEDSKKKADESTDLVKSIETLMTKLTDGQGAELKKVADAISDLNAKVEKFDSLAERIEALENQPLPTKAKASYVTVEKDGNKVETNVDQLLKRQEELIANPADAKPGEMLDLALQIRKANLGETINVNQQ